VEPVEGLRHDRDRRVETERVIRSGEVVVDGLGNADAAQAPVVELLGDAERVLTADGDNGVDLEFLDLGEDLALIPVSSSRRIGSLTGGRAGAGKNLEKLYSRRRRLFKAGLGITRRPGPPGLQTPPDYFIS
jgi:hypothetical protein